MDAIKFTIPKDSFPFMKTLKTFSAILSIYLLMLYTYIKQEKCNVNNSNWKLECIIYKRLNMSIEYTIKKKFFKITVGVAWTAEISDKLNKA